MGCKEKVLDWVRANTVKHNRPYWHTSSDIAQAMGLNASAVGRALKKLYDECQVGYTYIILKPEGRKKHWAEITAVMADIDPHCQNYIHPNAQ
jgi:transcription initiation factor IIE alpha subunit